MEHQKAVRADTALHGNFTRLLCHTHTHTHTHTGTPIKANGKSSDGEAADKNQGSEAKPVDCVKVSLSVQPRRSTGGRPRDDSHWQIIPHWRKKAFQLVFCLNGTTVSWNRGANRRLFVTAPAAEQQHYKVRKWHFFSFLSRMDSSWIH